MFVQQTRKGRRRRTRYSVVLDLNNSRCGPDSPKREIGELFKAQWNQLNPNNSIKSIWITEFHLLLTEQQRNQETLWRALNVNCLVFAENGKKAIGVPNWGRNKTVVDGCGCLANRNHCNNRSVAANCNCIQCSKVRNNKTGRARKEVQQEYNYCYCNTLELSLVCTLIWYWLLGIVVVHVRENANWNT